ncbi:pyridoxine 5-phosphate synthase [Pseudidiomarina indica]|uniref:Pyridoxine 5'-phosphate synthase n=1 Tax=Pseudidiomarina indica TaxID=1159017 RepID=A0A1G6ACC3_9GAMM|nr:pyridoxine 5'-phosphate synthase [Pseudidiomarina indica]SDB06077.1 pyridoxine 5-phosphate synthase [Pseudidiomarina indica]
MSSTVRKNPIYLGVNIDHVATVRNARGVSYPEPVEAAAVAERAGADGITVHLREDRRHITDRDVEILAKTLQTRMNLEMAVTEEMLSIACRIKPAYCCLVPEKREELTTEGGLDVAGQQDKITAAVERLAEQGIATSLFVDADKQQIDAAVATGAPIIELHTGHYADATDDRTRSQLLAQLRDAAEYAQAAGLQVNAGHGLHYHNTAAVAAIPQLVELNIGHAIIARAVIVGLEQAVRDMKTIMQQARQNGTVL